jgi:hypothetical protein
MAVLWRMNNHHVEPGALSAPKIAGRASVQHLPET